MHPVIPHRACRGCLPLARLGAAFAEDGPALSVSVSGGSCGLFGHLLPPLHLLLLGHPYEHFACLAAPAATVVERAAAAHPNVGSLTFSKLLHNVHRVSSCRKALMQSEWSIVRSVSNRPSRCPCCSLGNPGAANALFNCSNITQPEHDLSRMQGDFACDHSARHSSRFVGRVSPHGG